MSATDTAVRPQPATASSKERLKRVLFVGDELFITTVVEIVCAMSSPDIALVYFTPSVRATRELVAKQAADVIVFDYLTGWIDADNFKAVIQRMDPNIRVVPLCAEDTTQIQALLAELTKETK
ncbi:hypothetical protein KJ713_00020 [Patescibacteria group bacterium]|nr:hypothetical protein [Patescibacteria group bacterium]